jgi:PTH1 family peptidyl-tRNA hydrolase
MNLSGDNVLELARWFKIDTGHLIVIHDDLDLETGKLRIRPKGNSAGHKGVESIIGRLGTNGFIRIRIGIGKPTGNLEEDMSKYVLSSVPKEEAELIDQAIVSAADAAEAAVKDGLEAAMNKYNTQ